jgi:hypothetical protein
MIILKQPFAFSFWLVDQGHHKVTVGPYAHPMCRMYICSATAWSYSCPLCGTYSRTLVRVRKTELRVVGGMSTPRVDWLLGLPLSIFRHVASTFKRLTTATTHCDLINFYQYRRGNLSSHDTAHDPVHHPYSDCRIVDIQLLYHASDRKSLDFCWPY